MQCFLWDADEVQHRDALLRKWISEVKDSALQAEDLIETYVLGISRKRRNDLWVWFDLKWLACCWRDAITLHKVGSDVDALSAKISKMSLRLQTYGVKSSYGKYSSQAVMDRKLIAEQRRTYSHKDDKDIVGLDACVADLAERLRAQQRMVVVHGMGGIGKTTLARTVFRHSPIKVKFDGLAWAYISQQLQLSKVYREILLQLIPENNTEERELVQGLQESQLPRKLCDMLKQKKYLVILDDVWFSRDWECLKHAFPLTDTSHGSKLLVTTRNPQIFSGLADDVVSYYEVKFLDDKQSWQLLQKKANIEKDNPDSEKVKLGKKMLDHCKGHPLAIAVLGGVDESYSDVYEVLAMSYYELPYHLKPCFLLLGYFPEDYGIEAQRIYDLWIAEGVVSSTQDKTTANRSLEDICEVYLNELVQKSMVQVGRRDFEEKIQTCRLNDLMRDKCIEINKEEDFLQIVDIHASKNEHKPCFQHASGAKLRRMAVYFTEEELSYPLPKLSLGIFPPLRSLLFFLSTAVDIHITDCKWIRVICKDYKLLRVLDLKGLICYKGSLPTEVGNLIFLRYLSLQDTSIDQLPSSIGNLRSLMILDLRTYYRVSLPNVLWKLKSLKHLYLPWETTSFIRYVHKDKYEIEENQNLKLDDLSHLEKLEGLNLDRVDINGLVEFTNKIKVSAQCFYKVESLKAFLKSTSIKSLTLVLDGSILSEDPAILSACDFLKVLLISNQRNTTTYLPMNIEMLPQNLGMLIVQGCRYADDPMPILEELPKLRILHLAECYDGTKLACSDKAFPMLTDLSLFSLSSLKECTVEKGGFPKLQTLEIYNCPITMLPNVLPPLVTINCEPCVRGFENYGTCPYFKGW